MEQSNIPAEVLERIGDAAINAASAYSPEHSFGHIAREYYRKGRIDEYLHSLQQPEKVHPVYRGWDSLKLIGRVAARFKELIAKAWDWVSFYNGWLEGRAEMLFELQQEWDAPEVQAPAGPVWVKASDRTPIAGTEIYFEFAHSGDPIRKFTGYFLDLDGDQGFSAIVGRFYYLDKYAQYIRWLDESPSPREEMPRPAGEARANIPDGYDEWCEAHQSYYKEECPECAPLSPRAAADREKEAAIAFMRWVIRGESPYAVIYGKNHRPGSLATGPGDCKEDNSSIEKVYDLFLQSNP